MDNEEYVLYKNFPSNLKNKSKEILFLYILDNYNCQLHRVKGQNVIGFKKEAINQGLLDVLADLSYMEISKEDLIKMFN